MRTASKWRQKKRKTLEQNTRLSEIEDPLVSFLELNSLVDSCGEFSSLKYSFYQKVMLNTRPN